MRWTDIGSKLSTYYGSVAEWMANHPAEIDIAVVVGILGTAAVVYRHRLRMYRRLARLVRGANMRRKDQEHYQLMKFEDAITDAAMAMVQSGDMTEAQEKWWYRWFADRYEMLGLLPAHDQASVKRGCWLRLRLGHGLKPVKIPGGHPVKDLKVDPSYKPTDAIVVVIGLAQSKWAQE
jgi:hypothetical protein